MTTEIKKQIEKIKNLNLEEKVKCINEIKVALHEISPFNTELNRS